MTRVVATAGHVDHGKSTLLRRLTGMEPDRWDEERRRGLTIDLGFVWTTFDGPDGPLTVAFVDVPGHERFVPNMLAGAGAVADALLVVAADDGWSAQTAEHVAALDLLGVRGVVVAVTKVATVGADRVSEVCDDVSARLDGTSFAGAPVMALDSVTGEGLDAFASVLLDRLAVLPAVSGAPGGRLWVDRAFTIAGAGTVVTGTLQGGGLRTGGEVEHAPSGRLLRVRGLHALGEVVAEAPPGTRVAVNLARVEADDIHRGDALLMAPCPPTSTVEVVLRSVAHRPIDERGAWHLHVGSAEVPVRVRPVLGTIPPGGTGTARLELARPLPLWHGDRFVLRSVGTRTTPAGGRVLDPRPTSPPRGSSARLERAERLEDLSLAQDGTSRVGALLRLHGGHLPAGDVRALLGPGSVPAGADLAELAELGDELVTAEVLARWRDAALDAVAGVPPERGAFVSAVVAAVARAGCPDQLCRPVVDELRRAGGLASLGDVLIRPEDAATHRAARTARRDAVLEAMTRTPLAPPDLDTVAGPLGVVGGELQALFDDGLLVDLGHDVVMAQSAVDLAVRTLRDGVGSEPFTVARARDLWGSSRRHAVPLLEHLARRGVTSSDGVTHRLAAADAGSSRGR